MSTDPTQVELRAERFWQRREMPPMLADRWRSVSGPWGRFYAGMFVVFLFVYRPTTFPALAGIGVLVLVSSLGRRHPFLYALPVLAVAIGIGFEVGIPLAIGLLIFGHRWATKASRPDALAERLHLRAAALTGAPTQERYWRLETYAEARDRLLTFMRGASLKRRPASPFGRIRKEESRLLDPVRENWFRVGYTPKDQVAQGAYEISTLGARYPADCPDDNLDWQQKLTDAVAAKLPKMRLLLPNGTEELVTPSLIAVFHTHRDQVDWTVARPMPVWCTLADLPIPPWDGVVPIGLTSPDYPVGTVVDGVATAVWNLYSDDCPVPPEAHALVVGPTGSFKTTAVRTMIHGLREYLDAEIWAIDGKGEGAFAYLAGQHGCRETRDPAQAKAFVKEAYREMEDRYQINDACRRANQPLVRFRPIVLPIDEGMSWLDQLEADPEIDQIVFWLADIARRGRTGRVSIIWSTQRPDVRNVQGKGTVGQMRDNLGFRLAGAGITEIGARMIFGDSNGALAARIPKRPRARMGLMIGQDASQFGIIQLAYTPDPLARDTDPDGHPGPYAARAHDLADRLDIPLLEVVKAAEDEATQPLPPVDLGPEGRTRRRVETP